MKKTFIAICILISGLSAAAQIHAKDAKSDPSLPVYLVNGTEMTYEQVTKINTATIESMDVYKGENAIAKFGTKYKHGVVIVKLKKGKKK
jgi:hypothetical protein